MNKPHYVCQNCGYVSSKWMGRCPECNEWNSLVEEYTIDRKKSKVDKDVKNPVLINDIYLNSEERFLTGFAELDRVLGGGIVKGSLILIGGDPGIGKSTLLLQLCKNIGSKKRILYLSGEESETQIKMRASRLGIKDESIYLISETDIEKIYMYVRDIKPDVIIVDSVQTVYDSELESAPGSVSQVRQVTNHLMKLAKKGNITTFIVGHVTKDGSIAGPRVLEHMVDTVLYFEGDNNLFYRIIRTTKNRFGATNEIGVFEMTENGLKEIPNASDIMLEGRPENASGSCVTCVVEGTRPMLLEIQALVTKTSFGLPRRMASGFDLNRLLLISAVLEKRIGLSLGNQDIYVNIAGGFKSEETSCDLAVALAIMSSYKDKSISDKLVGIGEIGLSGEIRNVGQMVKRLNEAQRMGFKKIIIPKSQKIRLNMEGLDICPSSDLKEAIRCAFN